MSRLARQTGKLRPFDAPEQEAYLNLIRTQAVLGAMLHRLFKPHGLTESSYNLLRILRGARPEALPCSEIRARLVVPVPDVTRLLDRLEARGLVERFRDADDQRVVRARPTRKALALLDRLDGPLLEAHRAQLGHLAPAELEALSRLLEAAREPHEPRVQPDA